VAIARGSRIEQFEGTGLQFQSSFSDHPEMTHPRFLKLIDRESFAKV
jgi:hypothetical protein